MKKDEGELHKNKHSTPCVTEKVGNELLLEYYVCTAGLVVEIISKLFEWGKWCESSGSNNN